MPLIAHNDLPAFDRLDSEGLIVLSPERARTQYVRELHIGLLNMMPDTALEATERQFLRLIGESNPIAQFYVHPFTLPELPRGEAAQGHIDHFYESFETIREQGLDALIITGANVTGPELNKEPFWQPLIRVVDWAQEFVTSTLCSCLATHAVLQFRYGQKRIMQRAKRWGVFEHHVVDKRHPLVNDINTRFDVPHSRWNDVATWQFEEAGLRVLVASPAVGVHLATSPDGLRFVFLQGHPEYDTVSLLKEFKREVRRHTRGETKAFPPFPANYLDARARALLTEYRERLERGAAGEFPEPLVAPRLENTWHDTAEGLVGNWMGLVYQVTHRDRDKPFMDGLDPNDPLGLLS